MVTKVMKLEMPTLQEVLKDNNGNEDLLEELLYKFRLWLKQQIHLPQDISDQRLKFFISTAKLDFEKAKTNLDKFYTLRNLISEMYSNLDPLSENLKLNYSHFQLTPLPKLTPNKYRVHIARLIDYDDSKLDIWACLRYAALTGELRIEEDVVINNVFIYDCIGANFNHMTMWTPTVLKKLEIWLTASSYRVKAIHIINAPKIIEIFLKAAKAVMKAKLFNRIYIHESGIESLYKEIPKSILPMDYDGEQSSMEILTDMWRAKLIERRDWFLKEQNRKANESLRTNSVINPDDLFGIPGTFRKLQID